MDPGRRRELTRFGVPAAFLLAVTIAVLLIKAGLDNSDSQSTTVAGATTTTAPATSAATAAAACAADRKSTRLNSSHTIQSRMPSSA